MLKFLSNKFFKKVVEKNKIFHLLYRAQVFLTLFSLMCSNLYSFQDFLEKL